MNEIWTTISDWATLYGLKIIGAIAIIVIGRIVVSIITSILRKIMDRSNMDVTLAKFFTTAAKVVLLTLVFVAALGSLGVQTGSIIAVIGAAGLAVGFALQGSLSNLAAGIMIITFRPFRVGDYVEAGGAAGSVEEIHLFSTFLKTPDNRKVVVPNSSVTSGTITNYSANPTRRIDLVFGIGYGDDIQKAKQIFERAMKEDDRILADPAPQVAVSELADSSVNFVVRPWVNAADYWAVRFDLTEKIKEQLDAEGVNIPFPQRDVHLYQVNQAG